MKFLEELREIWQSVYSLLENDFSNSTLQLWFGSIQLVYLGEDVVILTIEKDFKKNFVETKYIDILRDHFATVLSYEVDVALFSGETVTTPEEAQALYELYITKKNAELAKENEREMARAIKVISPHKKSIAYYTFDNFIQGDSNKFAYAACYAIAHNEEEGYCPYNPLVIHGKSGLGKTHLMYAVINRLLERNPDQKVVYIKGEEFTVKLVEAIKNNSTEEFREKYRGADILLMDDIQFIAGKASTQEEFFHTFNALYENQKQIIVTSDRPIEEIKNLEERIRTRLEWGVSPDITPPDTELRMAIIRKKAEEVNLPLDEEIVEFIAQKLKSNVRLIESGVKTLSALRFIMGKEITYDLAVREISALVPDNEPQTNKIEKLIQAVCDTYNISVETMKGKSRRANVLLARQVAWYALRIVLELTYDGIGDIFGYDHTTVINGYKKVEAKKTADPEFADELDTLLHDIKENLIK